MATFFRNKVIKEVGLLPITAITTDAARRSVVLGISLNNLTEGTVYASIKIQDHTSVEGFYLKDIMIPPNSSLRAIPPGEKLILAGDNALKIQADMDAAYDAVISYVDIV